MSEERHALKPHDAGAVFFDDLTEGARWVSRRRTITEADLATFAGLYGEFNPIHVDAVAAGEGPYGQRLVHGILVLAVTSGLRQQLGVFHGSMRAMLEIRSWRFLRPVLIGDTITAVTTVVGLKPTSKGDAGVVTQRVDAINQHGETVQTGELVLLMGCRPQGAQS